MPETCRDIYDNKLQLLYQVGTSRHLQNSVAWATWRPRFLHPCSTPKRLKVHNVMLVAYFQKVLLLLL